MQLCNVWVCMQPSLSINYGKDFRQDYIELVAQGPPGGYVFTMAADYEMMWRGALMHSFLNEQRVSVPAVLSRLPLLHCLLGASN